MLKLSVAGLVALVYNESSDAPNTHDCLVVLQVNPSMVPALANWQSKFTIQFVLQSLRQLMMEGPNKKLTQPPEGSVYEQR